MGKKEQFLVCQCNLLLIASQPASQVTWLVMRKGGSFEVDWRYGNYGKSNKQLRSHSFREPMIGRTYNRLACELRHEDSTLRPPERARQCCVTTSTGGRGQVVGAGSWPSRPTGGARGRGGRRAERGKSQAERTRNTLTWLEANASKLENFILF